MENNKFIIKESTEKLIRETIDENYEQLSEQELIDKLNQSKKFIVRITESGQYEVKQVLLG